MFESEDDLDTLYTIGVTIELFSYDEGLINATEGNSIFIDLLFSGYSFGLIPVRVSTLTYSEYMARGFNIANEFHSDVIPNDAADGMYF